MAETAFSYPGSQIVVTRWKIVKIRTQKRRSLQLQYQ